MKSWDMNFKYHVDSLYFVTHFQNTNDCVGGLLTTSNLWISFKQGLKLMEKVGL